MNQGILKSKYFWFSFIFAISICLFLYGLHLNNGIIVENELERKYNRAKRLLDKRESEISVLRGYIFEHEKVLKKKTSEIERLDSRVIELTRMISGERDRIKSLQEEIVHLNSQLRKALNVKKEEIRKRGGTNRLFSSNYQSNLKKERFLFEEEGKGKITLFSAFKCSYMHFWIDGRHVGFTTKYFREVKPHCGANGTVSKVVLEGMHHVKARDKKGRTWDFDVFVEENVCIVIGFE